MTKEELFEVIKNDLHVVVNLNELCFSPSPDMLINYLDGITYDLADFFASEQSEIENVALNDIFDKLEEKIDGIEYDSNEFVNLVYDNFCAEYTFSFQDYLNQELKKLANKLIEISNKPKNEERRF